MTFLQSIKRNCCLLTLGTLPVSVMTQGTFAQEPPDDITHVLYVDDSASGNGDGLSWDTAFQTVYDALNEADNFNSFPNVVEIRIGPGTYKPCRSMCGKGMPLDPGAASFHMVERTHLVGGFAGLNVSANDNRDEWNPVEYTAVLTGQDAGDNSWHVVRASGVDNNARLQGLWIQFGEADDLSGDNKFGGGLFISALGEGPAILDCVFVDNKAVAGGAIFSRGMNVHIQNSTFVDNDVFDPSDPNQEIDGWGGGVYVAQGMTTLRNCVFQSNSAHRLGGGLYVAGLTMSGVVAGEEEPETAVAEVYNCTFRSNTVSNPVGTDPAGGAILSKGKTTAVNSIMWGNFPDEIGIGTQQFGAQFTVAHCDVRGGVPNAPGVFDEGGNIDVNPQYVNSLGYDRSACRLACSLQDCSAPCSEGSMTPCCPVNTGIEVDNGLPSPILANDVFDVDRDGDTSEFIPDRDLLRRRTDVVDMGAYEVVTGAVCDADQTKDGVVNVNDLFRLIGQWGPCPAWPEDCPGNLVRSDNDLTTIECITDDTVNVDDLIALIAKWGPCVATSSMSVSGDDFPEWYVDCDYDCQQAVQYDGADYNECMYECICDHFNCAEF